MRVGVIVVAVSLCIVSLANAGDVKAAMRQPTDIPAQGLGPALRILAKQFDFQVLYQTEVVQGKWSTDVAGAMTREEALQKVLSGTGLTYKYLDERTVTVFPVHAQTILSEAPEADAKGVKKETSNTFQLAQEAQGDSTGPSAIAAEHGRQAGDNLQEVIVTAQKYAQRAFDVPISLAVIGGLELKNDLVRNLDDLAAVVPGLTVVNNGTTYDMNIRGISNGTGLASLVGSYLDDADVTTLNFPIRLPIYDLQRIEVLRGPQGTLYGEGSIGGTIRYITNKPNLTTVQMTTDAAATFDQYGAPGQQIIGVVNTPIISNRLGIRAAADLDHEGGWMDQPGANQKNVNGQNITDVRIEGLWRPISSLSIYAMQVIDRATEGAFVGENTPGLYTQVFNLATTPRIDAAHEVSNLVLQWTGQHVQVSNSVTRFTYVSHDRSYGFSFQFTPPPTPRVDEYLPDTPYQVTDSSDELRLESSVEGPLHGIVGGFYHNITSETLPFTYYYAAPGAPGSPLPAAIGPGGTASSLQSKSLSAFGDVSYRLFNRLTVGAGVRDFTDREHSLRSGKQTQAGTFKSTDPRFYIRYGISNDVNVYASAAKGFRSGGFNVYGNPPYEPEDVWTYELGSKMRLFDHQLSTDADIFLSNYNNYQIYGITPPPAPYGYIVRNAGVARIKGIEGSANWIPTPGWKVGLNGDYIDARFVKINVLDSAYDIGDPLDFVPRYQLTASGESDFTWAGRPAFGRVEYSQTAKSTFRNRSTGPWYYSQSNYIHLLNFRAGIQWSQELKLGVFVRNLLNDRGFTSPDVIDYSASREQPRTFGFEFGFSLE